MFKLGFPVNPFPILVSTYTDKISFMEFYGWGFVPVNLLDRWGFLFLMYIARALGDGGLSWAQVCVEFRMFSQWVTCRFSDVFPPPQNISVDELVALNCCYVWMSGWRCEHFACQRSHAWRIAYPVFWGQASDPLCTNSSYWGLYWNVLKTKSEMWFLFVTFCLFIGFAADQISK